MEIRGDSPPMWRRRFIRRNTCQSLVVDMDITKPVVARHRCISLGTRDDAIQCGSRVCTGLWSARSTWGFSPGGSSSAGRFGRLDLGLRTFSCTCSAYPRTSRCSPDVSQPSACEMRPERNHRTHSSRAAENSPAPTPVQSLPRKNSCRNRPEKPSARALSQLLPLRDMLRVRPAASHIAIHPGPPVNADSTSPALVWRCGLPFGPIRSAHLPALPHQKSHRHGHRLQSNNHLLSSLWRYKVLCHHILTKTADYLERPYYHHSRHRRRHGI